MRSLGCYFALILPLVMGGCSKQEKFQGVTVGQVSRELLQPFDRPPITALNPNGFRLWAGPAFARATYLVELSYPGDPAQSEWMKSNAATGLLQVAVGDEDAKQKKLFSYKLRIPRQDYEPFIDRVDWLLAHGGNFHYCSDGTGVNIERIVGGRPVHYLGDLCEASDPSMAISALLLPLLRQYGPRELIPFRVDWRYEAGQVPKQFGDLGVTGMEPPEDRSIMNYRASSTDNTHP